MKNIRYGRFEEDSREFVITRPDTPRPWINYIMGDRLKMFISQAAGACLWYREPNCGRMTRYRFNGLPMDSPGFYLYVKDGDSIWNPSFFPTMMELDNYECRHGLGYTNFSATKNELQTEITYFIPMQDDVLIWDIHLTNKSAKPKTIKLYPYMEFSLHDIDKDTYAFLVCGNQARYYFDKDSNAIATDYFAFESDFMGKSLFTSSEKIQAFDTERDLFIGKGRTEANPIGLEQGLQNSEIKNGGKYACGVLETEITLNPGEVKRLNFRYAVSDSLDISEKLISKYSSTKAIDMAKQAINDYWTKALATAQVKTPDSTVNALLNTWFPNNIRVALKNARSISTRHTGSTAALRFRDTMQDAMPATQLFPNEARDIILKTLQTMLASGRTITQVNPETLQSTNTESIRIDAALWGVFTVHRYICETGDFSFLNQIIPYYDKDEGSILDHLLQGMRFIGDNLGENGLPKLFDVDWNDMLKVFSSYQDGGQSVMVAQQYIYAAKLMFELLDISKGHEDDIDYLEKKSKSFTTVLNSDLCWDGEWFKRLVFNNGAVMGSHLNDEAQIFLNTQSWASIAGTLDHKKVKKAMESIHERLNTPFGIRIFTPPLTKMHDGTPFYSNTPGAGENGGLFLHANTWAIIAEALLGNGERAWKYFSQILPGTLSLGDPDRYENEPYAFSSWIYGPDHERYGTGQLSWLTGGAAWIYTAGMEYILGIRPTLTGLLIDPCIPAKWKEYTVKRRWRGTDYVITVLNPHGLSKGSVKLKVNGELISGNILSPASGQTVEVQANIYKKDKS